MLLKTYIEFCMPTIELSVIDEILLNSQCKIDGVVVNTNTEIKQGQNICWSVVEYFEPDVDINWKLLWEGDEILAVHKPANLPVHKTTRNVINTLVKLVQRESNFSDAHLLHRLDLDTSGIVLLTKNKEQAQYWQPKLAALMQKKVYKAIVYGKPNWQELDFECFLNTKQDSDIRCKMYVCDTGKQSGTFFKVLQTCGDYSIIECHLKTGRKHQLRAHLAHLGHPIVGDKIYANNGEYYLKRLNDEITELDELKLKTSHHLLMAYEIELDINGVEQLIKDEHYSPQWIKFCNEVGLKG
ncbi:23S rRNA pseudouridine1911/1915/1917 synthase [Marinicellulosiphila megalodicopiae]